MTRAQAKPDAPPPIMQIRSPFIVGFIYKNVSTKKWNCIRSQWTRRSACQNTTSHGENGFFSIQQRICWVDRALELIRAFCSSVLFFAPQIICLSKIVWESFSNVFSNERTDLKTRKCIEVIRKGQIKTPSTSFSGNFRLFYRIGRLTTRPLISLPCIWLANKTKIQLDYGRNVRGLDQGESSPFFLSLLTGRGWTCRCH